jgi:hypothetical protein
MKAEPKRWKHKPFGEVTSIPYRATFNAAQFERLKDGLIPAAMEDKWFVYFEEPQLLFHRSWTGQAVYRIAIQGDGSVFKVTNAECDSAILAQSDPEYAAELLNFLVRNLLLGEAIPFPRPQGATEPLPGVLQHAVAGTGYRERVVRTKPWWRFWS